MLKDLCPLVYKLNMTENKLIEAVKLIRRDLLLNDEPLKAYYLLKELDIPELKPELDRTYALVRPVFEPNFYRGIYDVPAEDCESIEPEEFILNAGGRYARYKWIVDELIANKPKKYMDLACYVGSLVTTAAGMGIESYGVDITPKVIEVAKRRAVSAGVDDTAKFYNANILTFPHNKKFDMVSALEVLEHLPDPKKFIEHLIEICTGWCYVTTPNGPFGSPPIQWDWDGVEEHVCGHVRVFTKATLFELLEKCGCEVAYINGETDGLLWAKFRRKEVSNG